MEKSESREKTEYDTPQRGRAREASGTMPSEWQVGRPGETCVVCGRPFQVEERYFSALIDRGSEFERRDYCSGCWQRERPRVFSFWRTRRLPPEKQPRALFDEDVVLNLFLRLEGADEPSKVNLRYIVALMLMRKRILKFETVERQGETDCWVVRNVRDGTRHRLINPRLTEEEIQQLSEEVKQLLNAEV